MRAWILTLLLCCSATAATLSVCVTGTCPAGSYSTINAAIAALTAPGDVIEIYPGHGNGNGANGAPRGAYCGGDGNCSANNPIILKSKPFAQSANPFIIRSRHWKRLPLVNNRITPEYADGARPITALIYNPGAGVLVNADYGAYSCALPLGRIAEAGARYTANATHAPDAEFRLVAGLITEDSSTGYHEVELPFSSSQSNFQAVVRLAPVPVDATQNMAQPVKDAVNNGSGLIRITVPAHGLQTGMAATVFGVGGVSGANGKWVVTRIDADHLDLQGSMFSGAYTSGGVVADTATLPTAMVSKTQANLQVGGISFLNNDLLLVDQEVLKVTAGGGTSNLTVSRGQASPSGKTTSAQYMHYGNASVVNLSRSRYQATIRIDSYTCVVDMSDGLGSVVNVTSGATCAIAPLGYLHNYGYNPSGTAYSYWFQAEMTLPSAAVGDKSLHIGLADGNGSAFYAGNGNGKMYIYKPQVVDQPGEDGDFRCPANAYKLEGLEFGGGTGASAYAMIALPLADQPSAEMTRLGDQPKNITFEHILIRGPLEGARWDGVVGHPQKLYGTRQCFLNLGRNIVIQDSYLSGCAAQYQQDGAAIVGTPAGPVLYKNNYVDATASGLNTGISDAIHAFPMTFGNYFFMADFAHHWDATPFAPVNNAGVGGQVEISYNYIEKPPYARFLPWHPNTFVSKGTQWYPSTGGGWMLSVHTAGTTGDTEPAYCYAVNCLVQDGSAVWLMQIADQFYPLQYTAGAVYKVGDYVQAAYGSPFWKAQSGGVAGRNGLPGRCSLGQIVNDGSLDWKCYTALWAPNFPYKAHEVVNSPNLYNHNDKQVYAAADCISGNTEPSWDYREGAPTSGDGTCSWTISAGNSPWQSKNTGDNKTAAGAPVCPAGVGVGKCTPATTTSYQPWWYHHNYVYNSYAQHAAGGGQGNCINFQGATGQGFPAVSISNVLVENNVFDSCMGPGMIIQGDYSSTDSVFDLYCNNGPFSTDPRCPWNNYSAINGVPVTHDFTVRHNRFSRIQAPPNSPAAVSSNTVIQFSNMIDKLTVDHNYMDASQISYQMASFGLTDFPVSNMTWTNNLEHTGGGTFFNCKNAGSGPYKCGTSSANTTEFPALNFLGAQATYTAGSIAAGTWPNPHATYTDPNKIGGNVFAGGTSFGTPTAPANTGEGKLPSNNRFDAYDTLGMDEYYLVPSSSPIHNTALDGTDPGPDPNQQPIIMNLVVTPSPTGATIAFDLTSGSAGVTPVLQLSTKQGFDLDNGPWVVPQYDPSLVLPDTNGNTILSSDNTAHTVNGLHRKFILSDLTPGIPYYYRIHAGGQMVSGSLIVGSAVSP